MDYDIRCRLEEKNIHAKNTSDPNSYVQRRNKSEINFKFHIPYNDSSTTTTLF